MSARLRLATMDDLDRLAGMVSAFHTETGLETDDDHRRTALAPLLEGTPLGAIWMIGPDLAPVGYVCISFGWSLELGGMDGFIDEIYIRPAVRGRGMATEALTALLPELARAGVVALHLEVEHGNEAGRLYRRLGFKNRDRYRLMTWMAKSGVSA